MATKQKTTPKKKVKKTSKAVSKVTKQQPKIEMDSNVILALMIAFTILSIWFAVSAFVSYG